MRSSRFKEEQIIAVPREQEAGSATPDVYIASGKPTQNAFVESFNGRLRDELLNEMRTDHSTVPR